MRIGILEHCCKSWGARWSLLTILALLMVVAFGSRASVSAQTAHIERSKPTKSVTPSDSASTGQTSGQQVAVDPRTGKLRQPTPEEAKALSDGMKKLFSQKIEDITVVHHANGMVSAELPESQMDFMVVKINPDGTQSMECVKGVEAASAFIGTDATTQAEEDGSPSASENIKTTVEAKAGKANRKIVRNGSRKTARKSIPASRGKE